MLNLKKKKGGLLNELESKIKACQFLLSEREAQINQLEIDIKGLNERYKNSYNYNELLNFKEYLDKEYIRQEILDRIKDKKESLKYVKNSLVKNEKMYELFYKCYYYVDKSVYE